jgi:hypothetical protein
LRQTPCQIDELIEVSVIRKPDPRLDRLLDGRRRERENTRRGIALSG